MVIKLNHFDTKTKQDTEIEEKLENTLAEYLFPGIDFNIGTAYPEASVPQDLSEYKGMTLQFSARKRMYFASDPNIRSLLYPNPSDGAAYPLPFTPCRSFHELHNARVLVIDDVTGDSGGIIATSDAKKLVGDCKGLIDFDFARANNIEPRAFQFRLGIRPQEQSHVMRIAKGTLAPTRLDKLGESKLKVSGTKGTVKARTGYDMILATSSFKGRKGRDAIKPGEYLLDIGLGVKSVAKFRQHSLGTQILVNYPHAVKEEILPIIKQQAEELASSQKNPRELAQRYVESYEHRKALIESGNEETITEVDEKLSEKLAILDCFCCNTENEEINQEEELGTEQKDLLVYSLLKADKNGFCQLIEHPKIIAELQEFARKQWVDIATGRSIKFTSGLAQPSLYLQKDEICIPYLKEGAEIIVTRSPLINSNGVITLKNKHLPRMLSGCVYINPKTAMDNMQCDFDGDLLAFASSEEFPKLAAEVKEKNLPVNRYPDIIKKEKVPYQGSFTEIAVSAMENKIGIIANEIQKNIALQCEIDELPQSMKVEYIQKVSKHLNYILSKHSYTNLQLPGESKNRISQIAGTDNISLDVNQVDIELQSFKQLLKDCVSKLSNELQVATDGAKSALRPDNNIIQSCQIITSYKEVEWLADKKNPEAFANRGMATNGLSPIDLMIQQTNQIFEENQITARPVEQFRNLYPEIKFTSEQKQLAQNIKHKYNSLIKERIGLQERKKKEPGPYIVITSSTSGRKLEITNLIQYEISKDTEFWNSTELSIKIKPRQPTPKLPHPLSACIQYQTPEGVDVIKRIGTISMKSIREHNLKPGMTIKQGKVKFHFGISDGMVDSLKQQTLEYIESIRESIPENEKLQLAAAIHDVSHTEDNKNYSGFKKAGVAFAIFPDEVIGQLNQLQFTQMRVLGTQFNHYADRNFAGEQFSIKFENGINPRAPTQTARWIMVEGKKLGTIDASSPHLLPGCEAVASINSPLSKSVIITSLKNPDNKLQIDNVNKYAFKSSQWQNEQANIILAIGQTNPHKAPTVLAKVNNQILGTVNKKSVKFLQEKLNAVGKSIQGFTFSGILKNAPASYADIVIDPSTVKFPQIETTSQQNNKNSIESSKPVCTVLFFEASVDSSLQQKTEQMMSNMLKRAVERAAELGYEKVQFVDVSDLPTESSALRTIEQLAAEHQNITIDFIGSLSVEDAIGLMKEPSDIAIGIKDAQTVGIIEFVASHNMAIATYNPQTQKFDRRNLPAPKKTTETTKDIERNER